MSIVVRSLSERVFEVVREQILKGRLPNGEPIRQVADGKVWQSYSGRKLNYGASKRLDQAWAALRLPLLGLAIRRRFRRFVRRDDAP